MTLSHHLQVQRRQSYVLSWVEKSFYPYVSSLRYLSISHYKSLFYYNRSRSIIEGYRIIMHAEKCLNDYLNHVGNIVHCEEVTRSFSYC
jgi:hypothetical protein